MTTKQKEELRQVIIKANPEIMELKFGCEIMCGFSKAFIITDHNKDTVTAFFPTRNSPPDFDFISKSEILILGRPIRLADVLLAYQKLKDRHILFSLTSQGGFQIKQGEPSSCWNLKDDNLDRQSDETQEFLYNLLVTK